MHIHTGPTTAVLQPPRFNGQPGFYEIWFLVIFDRGGERALWLRYTTFAPAPGGPGEPRATVWAAAFDTAGSGPPVVGKAIVPLSGYSATAEPFAVRIGDSVLERGSCRGRVEAGGHLIEWDLAFDGPAPASRTPSSLHGLPLPIRSEHEHADVRFRGRYTVDGRESALSDARGTQVHISGTRRAEELYWLYCPMFEDDPDAIVEAVSVRIRRRLPGGLPGPGFTSTYLRSRHGEVDLTDLPHALTARTRSPALGVLHVSATSARRAVIVRAHADPATLVGYVYRDPAGWDVHVAQSDLASCVVESYARAHPLAGWKPVERLTARRGAAVEFHHPEPLPGVRYLGWEDRS